MESPYLAVGFLPSTIASLANRLRTPSKKRQKLLEKERLYADRWHLHLMEEKVKADIREEEGEAWGRSSLNVGKLAIGRLPVIRRITSEFSHGPLPSVLLSQERLPRVIEDDGRKNQSLLGFGFAPDLELAALSLGSRRERVRHLVPVVAEADAGGERGRRIEYAWSANTAVLMKEAMLEKNWPLVPRARAAVKGK